MKKIFLLIVCVAFAAGSVNAQKYECVFGVRAGLNVANLTASAGNVSESLNSKASFHVGFAYQQPLLQHLPLYFETGLYFTGLGAKTKTANLIGEDITGQSKLNMYYLQLPLVFSWHFKLGPVSIQPLVGVYYQYGISGKMKMDGTDTKINLFKSSTIQAVAIPQLFKRSDFGLRFGAGVAFMKRYHVGLGYDLGLLNISKESDGDGKIRNGNFYVSLGYNF